MKTIIIALPVPEDTDIFDVQENVSDLITAIYHGPFSEDDSVEPVVYEDADALLDDLGIEGEHRPWRACNCEDVCDEPDCWCYDHECPAWKEN